MPNLFIVAAPSGAGKSSLVKALLDEFDDLVLSLSYTTRSQRIGEIDGMHYHFVSTSEFEKMIADEEFLEYANVFAKVSNNYYGTARHWVEQQLQAGNHVLLEIDWQGAQQVMQQFPKCVSIFILPPSIAELEQRLRRRGRENDAEITKRMSVAKDEIEHCAEYQHIVVNDDFDHALAELAGIIQGGILPQGPKLEKFSSEIQQTVVKLLA